LPLKSRMDVEILEKRDSILRFRWKGTNPSLANALRRVIISEVPTLAIEDVIFFKNESPMSDEQIAHILAMIPLTTPRGKYAFLDECEKQETSGKKCRVTLSLEAIAGKEPIWVTSSMLVSEDPEVKPVNPNIKITKLMPGKSLQLEAHAILGKGKIHAKFQPGIAYYKFQPVITISEKCNVCGICVSECPRKVLSIENNKLVVKNLDNCSLCKLCVEKCPSKAIDVSFLEDTVIFTVESYGGMSPLDIVEEAVNVFKETFNRLKLEVQGEGK